MKAPLPTRPGEVSRRKFLLGLGAGAVGLSLAHRGFAAAAAERMAAKRLRGIFPIAQTPFTAADKLDIESLVRQVEFIERGGVHGFVWPQNASEWSTMTDDERLAGMEAIGHAGAKLRTAIILGVQGADLGSVRKFVKQAERVGADGIISLPPSETADAKVILQYFQEVGKMSNLPLFVQAVGNVEVDLLLELYRTVPTMRYVKDETGDPLQRVVLLREKSHDEIKVFSGGHGRKLIEEMELGFSGTMPAASLADMYVTTYDLWHAGKKDAAKENHARTLEALATMLRYGTEGMKYVLQLRGVFNTYAARKPVARGLTETAKIATGGAKTQPLDDEGKKTLQALVVSLKPYFKA